MLTELRELKEPSKNRNQLKVITGQPVRQIPDSAAKDNYEKRHY